MFDHKDPYLTLPDWRNTPAKGLNSSSVQRVMGRSTSHYFTEFAFTKWWTQYTEREHAKKVLKIRFYFNYFNCYSDADTQGSQEFIPKFSIRWFNVVQILSDRPPKTIQRSPLFHLALVVQRLDNTIHGMKLLSIG